MFNSDISPWSPCSVLSRAHSSLPGKGWSLLGSQDYLMGSAPVCIMCFLSKEAFATIPTNTYWPHCTSSGVCLWHSAPILTFSPKESAFQGRWEEKGLNLQLVEEWEGPLPDPKAPSQNPGLLKNLFPDSGPVPAKTNPSHVDPLLPWWLWLCVALAQWP